MTLLTRTAGQMIVNYGVVPGLRHEGFLAYRMGLMTRASPRDVIVLHTPSHAQNNAYNCTYYPEEDKLWDPAVLRRILDAKPRLVVVPKLFNPELNVEEHTEFLNNIRIILETGTVVETALAALEVARVNDLLDPKVSIPPANTITGDFLRGHVGDYIVHDLAPQEIMSRFYRNEIAVPAYLKGHEQEVFNLHNLVRLRELMLSWVSYHNSDVARSLNLTQVEPAKPFAWLRWNKTMRHALVALPVNTLWFMAVNITWGTFGFSLPAVCLLLLAAPLITALYVNPFVALLNAFVTFAAFSYLFGADDALNLMSVSGVLTLLSFLLVTIVTCFLGARRNLRHQQQQEQAVQLNALFRLAYDMAYSDTTEDVAKAAISNLRRTFSLPAMMLDNHGKPWGISQRDFTLLNEAEVASARKCVELGTIITPQKNENWLWSPLVVKQAVLGTIGLRTGPTSGASDIDTAQIMRTYSDIVSTSLKQAELRKASEQASQEAERESLRATLLSAVSHDLKTPLVSIIGSLSTLQAFGGNMPDDYRKELLQTASEEASRLHTIIHNVLEMTRFESGTVKPNMVVLDLMSVLKPVMERCSRYYPRLSMAVTPDESAMFWVEGDPLLLEEVLYNVLENAAKYGGREGAVEMAFEEDGGHVHLRVCDHGPGVPLHERDKIFDKYYRASHKDNQQAGSGLGLAICRVILDTCGASVWMEDRPDGDHGACVVMRFPKAKIPPMKDESDE